MVVEITDIRVYMAKDSEKIKAFAVVTLGGEFAVHGVKIMAREDGGLWVAMPRQKSSVDGSWRDVFHPITKESRERLYNKILKAYEESELKPEDEE
jgi:stage V sporulation protein G